MRTRHVYDTDPTTPNIGTYVTVSAHVPRDLARRLTVVARANDRSLSGEIRLALRRHLRDHEVVTSHE